MTTTEQHTSRGHRKHAANLERQRQPKPTPVQPYRSTRVAIAMARCQRRRAPGHFGYARTGYRGRPSTGAKVPFWTAVQRRRDRARAAKLMRRQNR